MRASINWLAGKRWVGELVRKTLDFWQNNFLTHGFYGTTVSPTSLGPDRWAQREGYGGSNPSEKHFQLFSLFIVYNIYVRAAYVILKKKPRGISR